MAMLPTASVCVPLRQSLVAKGPRLGAEAPRVACPANTSRSRSRVTCRVSQAVQKNAKMALLLPLAACTILTAWPGHAEAGLLSGSTGLESIQLPSFPGPDFIKQIQEANKKKYAGFDEKFKSSPLLQDLLKRSKDNAQLHKQEIQDKYCERGAEWGVGDCSLAGLSQAEKDAFMAALRKK